MANPAPGFKDHPNHTILLDTGPDAVTVTHGGEIVAMTTRAVLLREDRYPVRAYIPKEDVRADLTESAKTTHCPFKGDATYYSVTIAGRTEEDAAWSYTAPFDEVAAIKNQVCFDDRFEIEIG